MNGKWLKIGMVATVAALAAALVVGAPAFAQSGTPPTGSRGGYGAGMQAAWGGPNNSLVAIAAEVLGVDRAELAADLAAGQTIAEVAQAQGVALDTIVDAAVAPRADWLSQAVTAGRLTQAQADTMLATMRASLTAQLNALHPLNPRGMGTGLGFVDADGDGLCDLGGGAQLRDRGGRWSR